MQVEPHQVRTHDGWTLALTRVHRGTPQGPPVLFVPGFGMNGFIFRYHPSGPSFMEYLLDAGLDPWSVDLRGCRSATRGHGGTGLADIAFADMPAVFAYIAEQTGGDRVHAVGCSLGGTVLYAYGSVDPAPRLGRLVTVGSPLRWGRKSIVLRAFSRLGPLAAVPVRGSRPAARVALPVASRVAPSALSIYLNPRLTQTRNSGELTRTVEDPTPAVNREMARWIRRRDLMLGGVNLTEAMAGLEVPLLVIAGNGDGICPPDAAMAAVQAAGGPVQSLLVEDPRGVGHADLFIADLAPEKVFRPVAEFLTS